MSEQITLDRLSSEEIRVLGAMIEKSKTTPSYYPMTLNAIITACNQKSARNPVVSYDEETVIKVLDKLKKRLLVAHVTGDGRTLKYRHTLGVKYPLDPVEVTVLGLLFLRGALTVGEIKSTSSRWYDFEDLAEVQETLSTLSTYNPPFVSQMERKTGQKERRYRHLFTDLSEEEVITSSDEATTNNIDVEERLTALEQEVERLKAIISKYDLS